MTAADADPVRGAAECVWTIVVAAGSGLRFGDRKQFLDLAGRSVLDRAIDPAVDVSDGIVVVVPADMVPTIDLSDREVDSAVVAGGATRAGSVRAGLAAVPDTATIVLVHDAARPLAATTVFERVIDAVGAGADAVVPVVPVADTVRTRSGAVLDRDDLLAVQTPQGFRLGALRRAHADEEEATDDATLVEAAGGTVVTVEGDPANRKITDPADLVTATALLDWSTNA